MGLRPIEVEPTHGTMKRYKWIFGVDQHAFSDQGKVHAESCLATEDSESYTLKINVSLDGFKGTSKIRIERMMIDADPISSIVSPHYSQIQE
jgi:hypothetical protein